MLPVWIDRRRVAILASLGLLLGLAVPAAHVHLTVSQTGTLEAVEAHQHLRPHRLAGLDHRAFHAADDHDSGSLLTLNLDQPSALQDSGIHLPVLVASPLEIFLAAPPPAPRLLSYADSALVLPADPPLSPHGLRGPPAAL